MRQGSVPPNPNAAPTQPGAHYRRESTHSVQGDNANRPNFTPQGGRGRGYNPNYNNQMGYPPNNQFRNGPGQGRGMPPAFQPQGRGMPYPNSPQSNRSPAPAVPSLPGTPNMPPANMNMQTPPQYHYPPPMAPQQVQSPLVPPSSSYVASTGFSTSFPQPPPPHTTNKASFGKHNKKHKSRREYDRFPHPGRSGDFPRDQQLQDDQESRNGTHPHHHHHYYHLHHCIDSNSNNGGDKSMVYTDWSQQRLPPMNGNRGNFLPGPGSHNAPPFDKSNQLPPSFPINQPNQPVPNPPTTDSLDLSPENGAFERLLTMKNQTYGYPPQQMQDQYGRPLSMPYGYNNMPYMPPQGNQTGYGQQFVPPYHQHSSSMSRSPSQPERPSSATQQNTPVVVGSGTPQQTPAKPSNDFVKPRKSAAIQIKNAAGEVVDTSAFKQPASPAPTAAQQVKTPPVVASTPTPPPKATPTHARTESQAAAPKTAKEIQEELRAKIKQATQGNAPAEEDKVKPEAPAAPKAAEPEAKKEEPAAPAAPAAKEEAKPAEPAAAVESEEDEMERMIREMEEADAKREKEEEEHQKRRAAEKAAAKIKEEENRKANAADEDRKLREQEAEMERLEEEKERKRKEAESGGKTLSVAEALAAARGGNDASNVDSVADKLADMKLGGAAGEKPAAGAADKRAAKPAALNLAPINTKSVEPPQPTPAMQSLKSARFLQVINQDLYPDGISSPNPALNTAAAKKGKNFRYDASFLLQFQKVFTEQPSIQFHQQVKSLIGEDGGRSGTRTPSSAARQGSRGGASGFPGGPFNAPPGRGMPPGGMPKGGVNPMAQFQRPGAPFPGAPGMGGRSGSQRGLSNAQGRQNSRSTRGSRRDNMKEAQAAKTMPLTAGQVIKDITVSATGWKPTSVGKGAAAAPAGGASGYLDPELVQRKVKAALNKMTPEKFDRIADQILLIASQSKDESDGRTLRQVIQLTFEKATDEAHWASMYAKFCKRMLETMSPEIRDERIKDKNGNIVSGGNLFRKYLLNRCQEEFERGWTVNLPEPKVEEGADPKNGEAALMSDEYYIAAAAKRRGLGLVQFIGELYKLGMLTERIMHECVHKLVDYKGVPDEAEIESLCKLLRTIGANLDDTEKGRPMMDAYFARIQTMIDLPELPSRLQFMLMDVVDLRRARWVSKENNKGPKTLEEIRAEAEAAQAAKAQENARSNQRGGGGRPPVGRGDARQFSAGYQQQQSNQVGMDDLRRLKTSINRSSSQSMTLGPTSMFSSRSNSGRRMGPGGSLGRPGEDSGASSRAGTPPVRDNNTNSNAFSLLANMESEHPASPPSANASPALAKAVPDSDKKESE